MILVDTSVWGRIADRRDAMHATAIRSVQWCIRNDQPVIAAQSLYEFWVVATRPADRNGLNWASSRAANWLYACQRSCRLLSEDGHLLEEWLKLVTAHDTKGKPSHDARLVAYMRLYHVDKILTFNTGDFVRYGITVLNPSSL